MSDIPNMADRTAGEEQSLPGAAGSSAGGMKENGIDDEGGGKSFPYLCYRVVYSD